MAGYPTIIPRWKTFVAMGFTLGFGFQAREALKVVSSAFACCPLGDDGVRLSKS